MTSRTMETGSNYGAHQNLSAMESGQSHINIMLGANVMTCSKYYRLSQPNMGKELAPPNIHLQIDKLKAIPHIPKWVLKHSGHNPNA